MGQAEWIGILAVAAAALPAHNLHEIHSEGRRLPSSGPPSVEPAASHPKEMLECLRKHRYTPLACRMSNQTESVSSPPPPAPECGDGTPSGAICFYGRGRCQYDALRGWYCRCGVPRRVARGVDRAAESFALAPHCIDD